VATFGQKKRALPTFNLTMKNLVQKIHKNLDTNPGFGQIWPKKVGRKM
jgi:hypothetical protein